MNISLSSFREKIIPLSAAALVTTFHLATLKGFPAPFVDEIWYVARAWGYIQSGVPFGPLDRGTIEHFQGYWTYYLRLPTMLHALALRVIGQPDLIPLRITSLLFGALLLVAVFSLGKTVGGKQLGQLSMLLTALSAPFLTSAHMARTDIMAAALSFSALAIYFSHPKHSQWNFLAGIIAGLAIEFHPNSVIFIPLIPALMFIEQRLQTLKHKPFWSFIGGAVAGTSIYFWLHVFPYPQTYFAINRTIFPTHTPPLLTLNLRTILRAFVDTFLMLLYAYQPLFPLIAWVTCNAILHLTPTPQRKFAWSTLLLALGFTLTVRNKFLYYAVLITPALDILLGDFLLRFAKRKFTPSLKGYLQQTFVWGTLIGAFALNLSVLKFDFWNDYQYALQNLREVVQPEETIMGAQVYWLAFPNNPYYSWEELAYYQQYKPGATWLEALYTYKPEIFILDYFLDVYLTSSDEPSDFYESFHSLPRGEVEAFLANHADEIASFDAGYYGNIRVYKIHWNSSE